MQDSELIDEAVAFVTHIRETRAAARKLDIAPRTLKEWRGGKRTPMREPMRNKLISILSGEDGKKPATVSPEFWEGESRAAESRARAAEREAEAAIIRAVAARLEAENARDRQAAVSSDRDQLDHAVETFEAAEDLDDRLVPSTHRGSGQETRSLPSLGADRTGASGS